MGVQIANKFTSLEKGEKVEDVGNVVKKQLALVEDGN